MDKRASKLRAKDCTVLSIMDAATLYTSRLSLLCLPVSVHRIVWPVMTSNGW